MGRRRKNQRPRKIERGTGRGWFTVGSRGFWKMARLGKNLLLSVGWKIITRATVIKGLTKYLRLRGVALCAVVITRVE